MADARGSQPRYRSPEHVFTKVAKNLSGTPICVGLPLIRDIPDQSLSNDLIDLSRCNLVQNRWADLALSGPHYSEYLTKCWHGVPNEKSESSTAVSSKK